jgi:hypothetical protein
MMEFTQGDYVTVDGRGAVAWVVTGLETAPDDDTEWTGIEEPTGRIQACMVGDDRVESFDPDDLAPIADDAFCPGCGQTGCTAYVR